ncbi:MAG: hypothetical protein K2V38_26235 [Gemmataceae bacterium]|nr:hypothetical protein [Gemmataceae bacterium]
MSITIKCPDCGHTARSDDGEPETCPECEGTMVALKKGPYKAKATSLEEEAGAKNKKKSRPRDEDEDDRPKAKKKPARADEDDEDDRPKAKKRSRSDDEDDRDNQLRDGKAAKQLDLDPGFSDRALMKQVEAELSRGEVLHFACRPAREIAQKQGLVAMGTGLFFALVGVVVAVIMFAATKAPWFAGLVPVLFVVIGVAMAVLGPVMKNRQAKMGWYAVTDRQALVFQVSLWGSSGKLDTYTPAELRKMRVQKSFWLKGGGDLVFKTIITHTTRTERDAHGRTRTSTSTSKQDFGFLGIADVRDVETLVHEVLLTDRDDDNDD